MKYPWIDEYLMAKKGVEQDLQASWNWQRYKLAGKLFAPICRDEHDQPYYITLKLEPTEGEFWRGQYEDVIPGYYCNKLHWCSIRADGAVPDADVKTMLDHAYLALLKTLPKKTQLALTGEAASK